MTALSLAPAARVLQRNLWVYRRTWRGMSGDFQGNLTVDGDDVIRELLVVNLKMEGHEAVTAVDGAEALRVVVDRPPDVILLDINMPGINGLEALPLLRQAAEQVRDSKPPLQQAQHQGSTSSPS